MSSTKPSAGSVFIVAAPSGAGKSSLVNALLAQEPGIVLSVSFTTRAPRPGEQDGREYFFVSEAEFRERDAKAEFLESAQVHGNFYGTSKRLIEEHTRAGRDVLLEIDWKGLNKCAGSFRMRWGFSSCRHRLRHSSSG